mmetsp:Transcript_10813/g.16101  ORF Transcript_10813/g.16101 Transcript_10813/m.16101 type:complete len:111 (+) Transcript_10813:56-388(+)
MENFLVFLITTVVLTGIAQMSAPMRSHFNNSFQLKTFNDNFDPKTGSAPVTWPQMADSSAVKVNITALLKGMANDNHANGKDFPDSMSFHEFFHQVHPVVNSLIVHMGAD